jgi:4-amino-4-deoxy-L-arabinose transferase-like glycosyltransferase
MSNNKLNKIQHFPIFAGLFLVILLVVILRIHLIDIPLERDEGIFAYFGRLIFQGGIPYKEAYDFKPPLLFLIYGFFINFIQDGIYGIRIGLLLFNIGSIIFLFLIVRRLINPLTALLASAIYGFLTVAYNFLGQAAHATQLLMLPTLAGIWLMLKTSKQPTFWKYYLAGFLVGMGFVIKQTALFFCIFAVFFFFLSQLTRAKAETQRFIYEGVSLITGIASPLLIIFIWMFSIGNFAAFWFWNFTYPQVYGALVPLSNAYKSFLGSMHFVIGNLEWIYVIALMGLVVLYLDKSLAKSRLFISLFLFFSISGVIPGYFFYPHYYVVILPALAICVAIFLYWTGLRMASVLKKPFLQYSSLFFLIALLSVAIYRDRIYYVTGTPKFISKMIYSTNPFSEALQISSYIKNNSAPADKIFIFGNEPEILFYSDRKAATPFLNISHLTTSRPPLFTQMFTEISAALNNDKPKFVIVVNIKASWQRVDRNVVRWMEDYIKSHYKLTGIVDIIDADITNYYWDDDLRLVNIKDMHDIFIFKKISSP